MELILIMSLVIDTFIITSVNGQSLKDNIKTYLGIESLFAILGVAIGSFILLFVNESLFKVISGIIIILIQAISLSGINLPDKVNALLLGADSLIVFAGLTIWYVPILSVFECIMICMGSLIGGKLINFVPMNIRDHLSEVVMIGIGLMMVCGL